MTPDKPEKPIVIQPPRHPVSSQTWTRQVGGVGLLTSDGVLRLSTECAVACGHHLIEGAELGENAGGARARVRAAAQAAANELGLAVRVFASWGGRNVWTIHVVHPGPVAPAASAESAVLC
jgi:hypothetical protein